MHITKSYIKDLYWATHVAVAAWFLHSVFWWLVVFSYFQVCPQMYCIFTYIANDNTTFWCRLTWRQRIGFSTLLFGRHHQPGCSSPGTAVNMGETKEMQHFKEKLPEKNSFRYCCIYYGLGFFVFSSWVGGE